MSGPSHGWAKMEAICQRVHAGECKTVIQQEHGISTTTILKYYRDWCKRQGVEERREVHAQLKPKAAPIHEPRVGATVLALPDLHCPFQHPDALSFLLAVREAKRTNLTICLGDEIDAHAFSRYVPDPDGMSPGQELSKSIEALMPFYIAFPEVLVCESNHTSRPMKKLFEAGLPASFLPTYATMLKAPDGWKWASRWMIDDVLYIHGDNGKSGQYAHVNYMKSAKKSVVIGHIHSYAGVNCEGDHFAVNAGCLIDEAAYCFKYAKNMLVRVNLGCAVIYEGKYAEFIPMRLDSNGRWIGRL